MAITIRANKNSIDRLHQVKKSLIDVRLKKDEKDFNNIEFEKFKNLKISNLYFRYNKENRYIFKKGRTGTKWNLKEEFH